MRGDKSQLSGYISKYKIMQIARDFLARPGVAVAHPTGLPRAILAAARGLPEVSAENLRPFVARRAKWRG
jgi:hypothetical protein